MTAKKAQNTESGMLSIRKTGRISMMLLQLEALLQVWRLVSVELLRRTTAPTTLTTTMLARAPSLRRIFRLTTPLLITLPPTTFSLRMLLLRTTPHPTLRTLKLLLLVLTMLRPPGGQRLDQLMLDLQKLSKQRLLRPTVLRRFLRLPRILLQMLLHQLHVQVILRLGRSQRRRLLNQTPLPRTTTPTPTPVDPSQRTPLSSKPS